MASFGDLGLQRPRFYEVHFSFLFEQLLVVGSFSLALGLCVVARSVEGLDVLPLEDASPIGGDTFERGNRPRLLLLLFIVREGIQKRSREVASPARCPNHLCGFDCG